MDKPFPNFTTRDAKTRNRTCAYLWLLTVTRQMGTNTPHKYWAKTSRWMEIAERLAEHLGRNLAVDLVNRSLALPIRLPWMPKIRARRSRLREERHAEA